MFPSMLWERDISRHARQRDSMFRSILWEGDHDSLHSALPIARLLPELLAEVFEWYILQVYEIYFRIDKDDPSSLEFAPNPYCWFAVRHVCRRWRQIALDYPTLSSYICLTRPECVQHLLNESDNVPLHIYASWTFQRNFPELYQLSWALVSPHITRFTSSDVIVIGNGFDARKDGDEVSDELSVLPNMEALRVIVQSEHSFEQSENFFSALDYPNLRVCTLLNVHYQHLTFFMGERLRCLAINYPRPYNSTDTTAQIISALRCSPNLEELAIQGLGDRWYQSITFSEENDHLIVSPPCWDLSKVALPLLRELRLTASSGEQLFQLLDHIMCPQPSILKLQADNIACSSRSCPGSGLNERISELIEAQLHGRVVQTAALTLGKAEQGFGLAISVKLWSDVHSIIEDSPVIPYQKPYFELSVGDVVDPDFVMNILQRLPLSTATVVYLEDICSTPITVLREVLAMIPGVRELQLQYEVPRSKNLKANVELSGRWDKGSSPLELFAHLRSVRVVTRDVTRKKILFSELVGLVDTLVAHYKGQGDTKISISFRHAYRRP
ncbi:uncharacterized protein PHACADRAFT_203492 [Phanerochaete carnosa HHB-10118-sp]|uniref:F-box domain-containing protein n=1 Tax=Phanerochaete carnosa (strain HHB-10118-sp) TaxID=650164 RepID=K5VBH0_PHACS|nr:uncharacterized protein PHACADRAFT_203492 [Phanerochaete carnosa HHB-10118-sp]EKM60246.1 hypothetical protein PHACADRAFT_203492 [Phanerochaete carnosa HHB-10118-sp]